MSGRAEPLIPGTPARVQFDLLPISYIVKAGHRIRVSVTGADYRERDRQVAEPAPMITVHDTRGNPSQVWLPIVPTT